MLPGRNQLTFNPNFWHFNLGDKGMLRGRDVMKRRLELSWTGEENGRGTAEATVFN